MKITPKIIKAARGYVFTRDIEGHGPRQYTQAVILHIANIKPRVLPCTVEEQEKILEILRPYLEAVERTDAAKSSKQANSPSL